MQRSRIGLLFSAAALTFVGVLPPAIATAQPTPEPPPPSSSSSSKHSEHSDMLNGVLHGEGLVQTKDGPVRVALQNGEATRVTATTVTVRSTDGYTRSWQLAQNLKVYDQRHTLQPGGVRAGADLTVAGTATTATASTFTAKWVILHTAESSPPSESP
jgi:hypothetical protein